MAARIRFYQGVFSKLPEALKENGVTKVDGLLADLGVSRYQLSTAERGFSLMEDGALDMRMDRSQGITAADLVNELPEKALADLIYQLGEERRSRRISRAIVRARPILTTGRFGPGHRRGRAANGENPSGDANLHGVASKGER